MISFNVGERYGNLTIIGQEKSHSGKVLVCKCDCGKTTKRKATSIRQQIKNGNRISCGCLLEQNRKSKKNTKWEKVIRSENVLTKLVNIAHNKCGNKSNNAVGIRNIRIHHGAYEVRISMYDKTFSYRTKDLEIAKEIIPKMNVICQKYKNGFDVLEDCFKNNIKIQKGKKRK